MIRLQSRRRAVFGGEVVVVDPVAKEWFINTVQRNRLIQSDPQHVVLEGSKRDSLVEGSVAEELASDHRRGTRHVRYDRKKRIRRRRHCAPRSGEHTLPSLAVLCIDGHPPRKHERRASPDDYFMAALQLVDPPQVVGIDEGHILAPRDRHSGISSACGPCVLVETHDANSLAVPIEDFSGSIGRRVVTDNNLEVNEALTEDVVECVREEPSALYADVTTVKNGAWRSVTVRASHRPHRTREDERSRAASGTPNREPVRLILPMSSMTASPRSSLRSGPVSIAGRAPVRSS